MKTSERLKLDNLFTIHKLGEVCAENPVAANIWHTDKHDYVTLIVPDAVKDRFRSFWCSAWITLGDRLQVYHVQRRVSMFGDCALYETWYFITVDYAKSMLERFYEILPNKLLEMRPGRQTECLQRWFYAKNSREQIKDKRAFFRDAIHFIIAILERDYRKIDRMKAAGFLSDAGPGGPEERRIQDVNVQV